MENRLLQEIQEIKSILARIVGTTNLPQEQRFSVEALDKMAAAFRTMSAERGEWVTEREIGGYIKSIPWRPGKFIREELGFSNWFKRGHEYLYSKKDIIALAAELEARNIDLKRYEEFVLDKAAFDKTAAKKEAKSDKSALAAASKSRKKFAIPPGLKNITTSAIPNPDPELVRQDLARLKSDFKTGKLEAYVDIYKGTHAMLKSIYHFQKYLAPGLKRRCVKWCDDFNYANRALELITGKKEKFKAPPDPAQIQL